MRKAFVSTLTELAKINDRIMLLTGDLGYLLMEPFAQEFPDRFINVGVAEQNMIGLATGLAEAGMIPFVYSITPFAVLRPYEFIRNGPVYHNLPVRIVGAGGGFEYSHDGITHFGIDDVGVLRVQPGISIFTPADYQQASTIVRKTWNLPGPAYYRLGKDEKTVIPGLNGAFELGQAQVIGEGTDLLFISMGSIASEVVKSIQYLSTLGIQSTLMIVSSINPPPLNLEKRLSSFSRVITVEAHYINGGIGSLVAEVIAEMNFNCKQVRCGIRTMPDGRSGSQEYLYARYGINSKAVADAAVQLMENSLSSIMNTTHIH